MDAARAVRVIFRRGPLSMAEYVALPGGLRIDYVFRMREHLNRLGEDEYARQRPRLREEFQSVIQGWYRQGTST